MKKLWLVVCMLCTSGALAQGNKLLSKQEMYADFDTLTAQLKSISPHIPIKKDLWHYNVLRQIAMLRNSIDTIQNSLSFELLVNRVLNSCQDYHTSTMDRSDQYRNLYSRFKVYLPIAYVNGQYLVASSFINDQTLIPAGSLITHINHQKADDYVAILTTELVLRYDLTRKKFYSENFYRNLQTVLDGKFSLTLITPEGKEVKTEINTSNRLEFARPNRDTIKNQVDYWADQQVLYIKLFMMDEALVPMYRRKIAQFRNGVRPIKKIIIDIRDNGGGSDNVWQSVYEAILPGKSSLPLTIDGFDPHKLSRDYLKDRDISLDNVQKNNSPLTRKYHFYHYLNRKWLLTPTDSSLNFTGKIVVVGNEGIYSSGASAMLLPNARKDDQIYSVGRPTGMFLGAGYSPVVLTLSYSNIRYRIEPAIEVTGATRLADLMNDRSEYEVPYTLEEILGRERFDGNTLGAYYLKNFDPLIKKALAL